MSLEATPENAQVDHPHVEVPAHADDSSISLSASPDCASPTPPPDRLVQAKKRASRTELEHVIAFFRETEGKDFEQILVDSHPELMSQRDSIYGSARTNGVDETSEDAIRLKVVKTLLDWLFQNIEPPDQYTKETDISHYQDVASHARQFFEQAHGPSVSVPVSLVIAAWCHDIERYIPETKSRYLAESIDHYRKQAIHSLSSSRVTEALLRGAPVTLAEKESIDHLIRHHDYPAREPLVLLGQTLIEKVRPDLAEQLQFLMNADSLVFFTATIELFVRFKSQKNSPSWIWKRVITNIKRLHVSLREQACHSIMELDGSIKELMGYDEEDLRGLCPCCSLEDS